MKKNREQKTLPGEFKRAKKRHKTRQEIQDAITKISNGSLSEELKIDIKYGRKVYYCLLRLSPIEDTNFFGDPNYFLIYSSNRIRISIGYKDGYFICLGSKRGCEEIIYIGSCKILCKVQPINEDALQLLR